MLLVLSRSPDVLSAFPAAESIPAGVALSVATQATGGVSWDPDDPPTHAWVVPHLAERRGAAQPLLEDLDLSQLLVVRVPPRLALELEP